MAWHRILILAATLGLFGPASAWADFQTGLAAYDRGAWAEAYAQWLPLAQKDDLAAQRNVAQLYRMGRGVPQDFGKAVYWYRRAAERGLASAQVNLAVLYLRGEGVPKNPAEAARWLTRAAQSGHAVAEYNLAMMYEAGLGVKRDEAKAMGWYYLAARNGEPQALKRLGQLVPFNPLNPPPGNAVLPDLVHIVPNCEPVGGPLQPARTEASAQPVLAPSMPAPSMPAPPMPAPTQIDAPAPAMPSAPARPFVAPPVSATLSAPTASAPFSMRPYEPKPSWTNEAPSAPVGPDSMGSGAMTPGPMGSRLPPAAERRPYP